MGTGPFTSAGVSITATARPEIVTTETAPLTTYPAGTPLGLRGFPLAALKATDREGFEYDPLDTEGEHAEILTVPQWFPIASLRGKVLWDGLWSCYYDIHLSLRAWRAGWRTKQNEDVPDCPPLWGHKSHYWAIADLTYDLKRGSQGAIISTIVLALPLLKAWGLI
jgi:hypothetical protein